MKMAEHDWSIRADRASVKILKLLTSTVTEVVDHGKPPENFDNVQFAIFDIARSKDIGYVDCREIVEWSCQLLFSLQALGVDIAIDTLKLLSSMMMDDATPTAIQFDVFSLIRGAGDPSDRGHILATISNFIMQLLADVEGISYR